jgi:hypothetical protein
LNDLKQSYIGQERRFSVGVIGENQLKEMLVSPEIGLYGPNFTSNTYHAVLTHSNYNGSFKWQLE